MEMLFEESGTVTDLPRSGHPRLTCEADHMRIVANIRDHPFTTAVATTELGQLGDDSVELGSTKGSLLSILRLEEQHQGYTATTFTRESR
ncbi:hypothetical protein Hamer_G025275 [Homarus americanus]|uniref:Uncharacterized protein n=1 Tax=Homarus americanus TaxID=6706 RepID=A0A8J5N6P1_HOMAM|nr:hypothetical protein Hamer_G025275 [Homarus americanus]